MYKTPSHNYRVNVLPYAELKDVIPGQAIPHGYYDLLCDCGAVFTYETIYHHPNLVKVVIKKWEKHVIEQYEQKAIGKHVW